MVAEPADPPPSLSRSESSSTVTLALSKISYLEKMKLPNFCADVIKYRDFKDQFQALMQDWGYPIPGLLENLKKSVPSEFQGRTGGFQDTWGSLEADRQKVWQPKDIDQGHQTEIIGFQAKSQTTLWECFCPCLTGKKSWENSWIFGMLDKFEVVSCQIYNDKLGFL